MVMAHSWVFENNFHGSCCIRRKTAKVKSHESEVLYGMSSQTTALHALAKTTTHLLTQLRTSLSIKSPNVNQLTNQQRAKCYCINST